MAIRIPPPPPSGGSVPFAADNQPVKLPPVPFLTMSEKVSTHQLHGLLPEIFAVAIPPENGPCRLPLMAFFIGADLPQRLMPLLPVEPDRLFLLAGDSSARAPVMTALAAVALREPNHGKLHLGRLELGDRTPLRDIFRQMAAVPITVFSITLPRGGGTLFFIRTPFTIRSLFDELALILPVDRSAGPP